MSSNTITKHVKCRIEKIFFFINYFFVLKSKRKYNAYTMFLTSIMWIKKIRELNVYRKKKNRNNRYCYERPPVLAVDRNYNDAKKRNSETISPRAGYIIVAVIWKVTLRKYKSEID